MILDRLTVRERVSLLALIPLLMVVMLSVPLVTARLDGARADSETTRAATAATQVDRLIELIQEVRLLSICYETGTGVAPNTLAVAMQDLTDERSRLAGLESITTEPQLVRALTDAQRLRNVNDAVLAKTMIGSEILDRYGKVVDNLIDALELDKNAKTSRTGATQLGALSALLRADEADSRRAAALLLALADPDRRSLILSTTQQLKIARSTAATQFERLATPSAIDAFALADHSLAEVRLNAAEIWLLRARAGASSPLLTATVLAAATNQLQLRHLVKNGIAGDLASSARQDLSATQWITTVLSLVAVAVLITVIVLSTIVGRSVSRPLRRLTIAAGQVADLAQDELLRVADEDTQEIHTPRLAAIDIQTDDEIGDLATAFNRVQTTAALLLERQVVSRRNVASMFASMGRRTSNLVGRQLSLIDTLERAEEDPDTLATLYRLDHTATRLRRNASSLVVLSGGSESLGEGQPTPIGDVVRAALGTVEEYQRVSLRRLPTLWVSPDAVGDLALLLAELLDNAVSFSPPRTQVEVVATLARNGTCTISMIDHGMGMPPARMAEENSRLRRRERLDLAPSDVLGLFVVGRIARRHNIEVLLEPTLPTGVSAVITLPASLMVDGQAATPQLREAGSAARREQADAAAGATSRQLAARAAASAKGAGSLTGWPVAVPRTGLPDRPTSTERPAQPPAAASPPVTGTPAVAADASLRKRVRGTNWAGPPPTIADPSNETLGRLGAHPNRNVPIPAAPIPAAPIPAVPIPAVPIPVPPPGSEGIARRVPGSHLTGLELALPTPDNEGTPRVAAAALDPEAVRHELQDVEQALDLAQQVAEHGEPDPPPPPPAEIARRAGLHRRVPGVALANLGGAADDFDAARPTYRSGNGPDLDADRLRSDLDAVDEALVKAQYAGTTGSITAERLAEQARRSAADRPGRQGATVQTQADGITVGGIAELGLPPAPVVSHAEDQQLLAPQVSTPAVEAENSEAEATEQARPLVRRIRGASLPALLNGPSARTGNRSVPVGPLPTAGRPMASVPERPDDVRAWAEDLEAAMSRLPDTNDGPQKTDDRPRGTNHGQRPWRERPRPAGDDGGPAGDDGGPTGEPSGREGENA